MSGVHRCCGCGKCFYSRFGGGYCADRCKIRHLERQLSRARDEAEQLRDAAGRQTTWDLPWEATQSED